MNWKGDVEVYAWLQVWRAAAHDPLMMRRAPDHYTPPLKKKNGWTEPEGDPDKEKECESASFCGLMFHLHKMLFFFLVFPPLLRQLSFFLKWKHQLMNKQKDWCMWIWKHMAPANRWLRFKWNLKKLWVGSAKYRTETAKRLNKGIALEWQRFAGRDFVIRIAVGLQRCTDDIKSILDGSTCIKFCSPRTGHQVGSALSVVFIDVFCLQGHSFIPLHGQRSDFLEAHESLKVPCSLNPFYLGHS